MRNPNLTIKTFQPGLYYVGDISYLAGEVLDWDYIVGMMFPENEDPKYGTMVDNKGNQFAVLSTMYGDGVFYDEEDYEYAVDSGTIGVYPISRVEDADECFGQVWTFDEEFVCTYDEETGVISVADINIHTNPFEDECASEETVHQTTTAP